MGRNGSYLAPDDETSAFLLNRFNEPFPMNPLVLGVVIAFVFSSLLGLVYLTLRSYRALAKFHLENDDEDPGNIDELLARDAPTGGPIGEEGAATAGAATAAAATDPYSIADPHPAGQARDFYCHFDPVRGLMEHSLARPEQCDPHSAHPSTRHSANGELFYEACHLSFSTRSSGDLEKLPDDELTNYAALGPPSCCGMSTSIAGHGHTAPPTPQPQEETILVSNTWLAHEQRHC